MRTRDSSNWVKFVRVKLLCTFPGHLPQSPIPKFLLCHRVHCTQLRLARKFRQFLVLTATPEWLRAQEMRCVTHSNFNVWRRLV